MEIDSDEFIEFTPAFIKEHEQAINQLLPKNHLKSDMKRNMKILKNGDWLNVMRINNTSDTNALLWPKPEVDDLKFIYDNLVSLKINKLTSIGSGTGLLEWLLYKVTGVEVNSIEVDKQYWSSKYRRYCFYEHIFPDDDRFQHCVTSPDLALMFCYFNNMNAFEDYLMRYKGNVLIIIGPSAFGKYTNPMPYDKNIPAMWRLFSARTLSGNDLITIYTKQ